MNRRTLLGVAGAAALAPLMKLWQPKPTDIVVAADVPEPPKQVTAIRIVDHPSPHKPGMGVGEVFRLNGANFICTGLSATLTTDCCDMTEWPSDYKSRVATILPYWALRIDAVSTGDASGFRI